MLGQIWETTRNTDYSQALKESVKSLTDEGMHQTIANDLGGFYNNAVGATSNFYENVDKSYNSQYKHEVILASQDAAQFAVSAIGTAIPATKALSP